MRSRPLILAVAAFALSLSGCGKGDETAGAPATSSTPIAKIAAPAGQAWADKVTVTPDGGWLMGNPDAPIKLVEYGALSCSHCAEFAEAGFAKLRDDYIASAAGMTTFFAERGVSADQGAACLADAAKATAFANATQEASEKKGISGTPWFFINGKDVQTQTWATLEPMLQSAGAR